MRPQTLSLAILLALHAVPASAGIEFPEWDVSDSCKDFGISFGGPNFTKNCMASQDAAKRMAKKHWSKLSDGDREECKKAGQQRRQFSDYRSLARCVQSKI